MTDFIGRGEERAVEILNHLFTLNEIRQQVPIKNLIFNEDFNKLGAETNKHKHDIVVLTKDEDIVIEVNYNHGKKAWKKWNNVYKPALEEAGCKCVTIDDNECESLFQLKDGIHRNTWQDYIDVIHALNTAGVKPQ